MHEDERSPRRRVAIVIETTALADYVWLWTRARNAELIHDLRRRGIDAAGVRIDVDGPQPMITTEARQRTQTVLPLHVQTAWPPTLGRSVTIWGPELEVATSRSSMRGPRNAVFDSLRRLRS